ncbi:MAG: SufD family Fe-S cluster assembly protein, partial [Bacteroidota bacterium]|nr:SufD family Fe-S cluster assembly protein [Bacteroidota bacterium]
CNIPDLNTIKINKNSGGFTPENTSEFESMKDLIEIKKKEDNHTLISIKDFAQIDKPLQIINLLSKDCNDNEKISILVGKNAKVTILYCDDTLPTCKVNASHTMDIKLDSYSQMAFYKMENVNNQTHINSDIIFDLSDNAYLQTFFLTLNGGKLSNKLRLNFNDVHSEADINGLYLMDKEQSAENIIEVHHLKDSCKSTQLFKGILDDEARANFIGHILVDYYAKNNEAKQTNNNILLTDKARVNTKPILEIYNDDVQCSHGATTGQLDENALYYLKTRGISEKQAKMLLMNAFCQNVLSKSTIKELREGLSTLIQKRLEGELSMENPFKITL